MRIRLLPLGLFLVATGVVMPPTAQAQSLAGTWKINAEQSEDAMEKLKDARATGTGERDPMGMSRGGRPRVGTGRIPGGGGGGPPGGAGGAGGPPGGDAGGGGGGSPIMRFLRPVRQLVITQDDSMMVLNDGLGLPRMLYLDGRQGEEVIPGGTPVVVVTKWKGGKLTVERKFPDGSLVREALSLDKESHRLIVEMRVASPSLGQTIEFRRAYDPAS